MNIDELEAKHLAATPGPWSLSDSEVADICGWLEPDELRPIIHCSGTVDDWANNSAFIAAAHNAMPELIAAWRELQALRKLLPVADNLCDAAAALVEQCDKEAKP